MSRAISISQLCNRSTQLHLCGYTEEVLDNLIQSGDLRGHYNTEQGELMVDKDSLMNFMPSEKDRRLEMENDYEESLTNKSFNEGLL